MTLVAVASDKFEEGYDGPASKAPDAYQVLQLEDALTRKYQTDAHLVTYVVEGASTQCRINKDGLAYFPKPVSIGVFFCDLDNPDHQPWNRALLDQAQQMYRELDVFRTAGTYLTRNGWRIVQPLAQSIPAQHAEPYIRRWLLELEAAGLVVDWGCRVWNQHFRLPHVRRDGVLRPPLLMLFDHMRPIELEPIERDELPAPTAPSRSRSAPPPPVDWSADVPELWLPRVERIALAIKDVTTEWHSLFMALAGSLLSRGAPPEHVPALCRAISLATGADDRTVDRETSARTTAQRKLAGASITGYGELCRRWPGVADALDVALARGADARLRALAASGEQAPPPSAATAAMEEALRRAADGLTTISAECGLGKTRAALVVASERAAKPYASAGAQGLRAPPGSKTAISVDKNILAQQLAADLAAMGTPARRIFGPLSVVRADNAHECRYHAAAKALVEGGQSMQWELCRGRDSDPCDYFDECTAHRGSDGPDDARVIVGPHALLKELSAAAGSTGLLVIDEPPDILESTVITLDDLEATRKSLSRFEGRYAGSLEPVLIATKAWLSHLGQPEQVTELDQIVRRCADQIPTADLEQARRSSGVNGDAVECARAAPMPEGRTATSPPIQAAWVSVARRDVARARELGDASRVLRTLHNALVSKSPVAVRIDDRRERRLAFTAAREEFVAALRREGAVVVTDANAEVHRPVYARVVGYEPPHYRFAAADGAPIERTLIRNASATRKTWLPRGKLKIAPSLVGAVRSLFEWAAADPSTKMLGLITMQVIELALRAAHDPSDTTVDAAWRKAGQSPETLAEAREKLGPIVAAWPGTILFGHYFGVRGMNTMADVDAVATLGDPWPNLGVVRNDVAFIGLDVDWDDRLRDLCRAELEQAHGRLRFVHRTRPGRALHIGNVLPGGSGWASGNVKIRRPVVGRPRATSSMGPGELAELVPKLGGLRAAARALGCQHSALKGYLEGKRGIPSQIADRFHTLFSTEARP